MTPDVPLVVWDVLAGFLRDHGVSGRQLIALGLVALPLLYWRKAVGVGSTATDLGGRIVFAAVVIGVLLALGVIPGIHVGRAWSLLEGIIREIAPLIRELAL